MFLGQNKTEVSKIEKGERKKSGHFLNEFNIHEDF